MIKHVSCISLQSLLLLLFLRTVFFFLVWLFLTCENRGNLSVSFGHTNLRNERKEQKTREQKFVFYSTSLEQYFSTWGGFPPHGSWFTPPPRGGGCYICTQWHTHTHRTNKHNRHEHPHTTHTHNASNLALKIPFHVTFFKNSSSVVVQKKKRKVF